MARQAADDGIEAICATPHIRADHEVEIAELPARIETLNRALLEREIPVDVLAGGEVAETSLSSLGDAELDALALGGGRWILLEPKPGPLSDSLSAAVDQLSERGFGALIAHPERHADDTIAARLRELTGRGALVQVTAEHLARERTAPLLLELAEEGLVHLLGSDAHSSRAGRPVRLSPALERLETVERLCEHLGWIARDGPRALLGGGEVRPPF